MQVTVEKHGVGWFLPKFNWTLLRIPNPHLSNVLRGNLLTTKKYKQRWQAVKDLQSVFFRFSQAEIWIKEHSELVQRQPQLKEKWADYLIALIIEQFRADVQRTQLEMHKQSAAKGRPLLSPKGVELNRSFNYCYKDIKTLFLENSYKSLPSTLIGNRQGCNNNAAKILSYLFSYNDDRKRVGWEHKPYRQIYQRVVEIVGQSTFKANFRLIMCFTYYFLPILGKYRLITITKQSKVKGLQVRLIQITLVAQGEFIYYFRNKESYLYAGINRLVK